ncbi:MAG: class II glutamine amidotransferase [Deltaproteobacteria bacterium]|nr:class II glutamine amidotransferase [Deltaproteobacteria bacterium]
MCRLFGFRSVIPSQVHRSLVAADNALAVQSQRHPDGWGVAYYVDGAPHVMKTATGAMDCALFQHVSGIVASETVVAHIRRATQGVNSVLNSHPFQHGRWVMCHNGDVPAFADVREAVESAIAPRLRRYVLGDTDSERIFFLFLTELAKYGPLAQRLGVDEVITALEATVARVREIADGRPDVDRALLTLLVTDGTVLAAIHGGKELFYSSYKNRCSDRGVCASLAPQCEAPTATGFVNHLIVSSEPLQGENVWLELAEGDVIGVDWRMRLVDGALENPQRALAAAAPV